MQAMPSTTPLSRTARCTSSVMSVTVRPPAVRSRVSCWKTFIAAAILREAIPDAPDERTHPQRILRRNRTSRTVPAAGAPVVDGPAGLTRAASATPAGLRTPRRRGAWLRAAGRAGRRSPRPRRVSGRSCRRPPRMSGPLRHGCEAPGLPRAGPCRRRAPRGSPPPAPSRPAPSAVPRRRGRAHGATPPPRRSRAGTSGVRGFRARETRRGARVRGRRGGRPGGRARSRSPRGRPRLPRTAASHRGGSCPSRARARRAAAARSGKPDPAPPASRRLRSPSRRSRTAPAPPSCHLLVACPSPCPSRRRAAIRRPPHPARAAAPTRTSRRLRLDEAAADRVAGQLDAVAHAELVEDVLAVSLDGQLQDLQLPRGEDVELLLGRAAPFDEVLDQRRDRRRVEERLAAHRPPNRVDDVLVGVGLEDVAGGAGLERFEEELLAVVHREHEQLQLRLALVQLCGCLDPGRLRHRDVEDHEIDVRGHRFLHRFGPIRGFGDDLEVGLGVEDALQAGADDRVVVGDQDPRDERDRHQGSAAGTSSRTSAPPPLAVLTASAPPTRSARSRIPRKPPCPLSAVAGSRPRPSSAIRRTTLPGPGSSTISTCVAPAWRATLVRLSWATR